MKLKLDENIDLRVVTLLQLAGHDIATNAAEVTGKLWIIQRGSIQEYRPIEPDV